MSKVINWFIGVAMMVLLLSGGFAKLYQFFGWLFLLQYSQADISVGGQIFVRIATFLLAYSIVGLIFHFIGFFNGKVMSAGYFILSTLIGFGLNYIVMLIESHIKIVLMVMGALLGALIVFFIVLFIVKRRRKTANEQHSFRT